MKCILPTCTGSIACRAHRVGVGWSPRIQRMGVAPDLALVGVLSCQEGHPRRHAEGRSAVGVGEDRAPRGEGVQVGGHDGRFAVAAGDVGVVLVRLDVEDVGALRAVRFSWSFVRFLQVRASRLVESAAQLGVQVVPERVAEQVESENCQRDRHAGEDHHPP